MTEKIIEKLNVHLANGLKTEADVVYFFVQIRKLIEKDNKFKDFPTLQFYCNWIVHTKINNINQPAFVEMIDKLNNSAAVLGWGDGFIENGLARLTDSISDRHIKNELATLMNGYGIHDDITEDRDAWLNVFKLLISVLMDLPLIPPKGQYSFIEEFRFIKPVDNTHIARIRIISPDGKYIEGRVVGIT